MKPLKQLKVKVFTVGNRSYKTVHLKAKPGHIFTPEGEEYALRQFAEHLEQQLPFEEFTLKQIGRGEYNIVHVRTKPADEREIVCAGMPLGEVASVEVGS